MPSSIAAESELQRLSRAHPLEGGWTPPELFIEKADVAGVHVWLAGLTTTRGDSVTATGSAAGLEELPLRRAYGELLERTVLLDAVASGRSAFDLLDADRRCIGSVDAGAVFPKSPKPGHLRYSISNGTAAATTWSDACERSRHELIERDLVLRSWYGHTAPKPLPLQARVPEAWRARYTFGAYRVGASADVEAVVVAGFPERLEDPLTLGFGAHTDPQAALQGAWDEAAQRLGFLWGEDIPLTEPSFSPGPEYHQEYYLNPETHSRLRAWLAGNHTNNPAEILTGPTATAPRNGFVELGNRGDDLVVVKCIASERLQLAFGLPHPDTAVAATSPLAVHPIA